MRKGRIILLLAALCMAAPLLRAQGLWTSAEMKFRMTKGLSGYVEGEYRTADGLDGTETVLMPSYSTPRPINPSCIKG